MAIRGEEKSKTKKANEDSKSEDKALRTNCSSRFFPDDTLRRAHSFIAALLLLLTVLKETTQGQN